MYADNRTTLASGLDRAAGGLAALGYPHLVASIFLPALLLLVVMASVESRD